MRGKFFIKLARVELSDTLWVENFAEIALSLTQLYCLLQDMDNVQNAVNPLSVI